MEKLLYLDIEWANPTNKSICQIAFIVEDLDNNMKESFNEYINPDDDFDIYCSNVHHITKEQVKDCITFDSFWNKYKVYFKDVIIIGHNVGNADLDALVKNLNRYEIEIPHFKYIDTYELATNYVPYSLVNNYALSTLCDFFKIDYSNAHNASYDVEVCYKLLDKLALVYSIDLGKYIKNYEVYEIKEFNRYTNISNLNRELNQLFGAVRGIKLDEVINEKEKEFLYKWYIEHKYLKQNNEVKDIIIILENILEDGIVTVEEIRKLSYVLSNYVYKLKGTKETLGSQELQGIIQGIIVDNQINEKEINKLTIWLYDNDYLEGYYPYDKIIQTIKDVLKDNIITKEEREMLLNIFNDLFNPLSELQKSIVIFECKSFCLSGNFKYGSKKEVEEFLISKGGLIHSTVKKTTDYVVIGEYGSEAYSNGTIGIKIKKALELNKAVIKEKDLFN